MKEFRVRAEIEPCAIAFSHIAAALDNLVGDFEGAVTAYKKAIGMDPTEWVAMKDYVYVYFNMLTALPPTRSATYAVEKTDKCTQKIPEMGMHA